MKDDPIPDKDHVARHCGPSSLQGDEVDARIFLLRKNELSLSVNWQEFFIDKSQLEVLNEIRLAYRRKGRSVSVNSAFLILNVGTVRTHTQERKYLDFRHDPLPDDLSHAGVFGCPEQDEILAQMIADCVEQIIRSSEIPD